MDYTYNIFTSSVCNFDLMHDNQYITVYFVISGLAKVTIDEIELEYGTGDIFVTTPEMKYSQIQSIDGSIVCLSINKVHFNKYYLRNARNITKTDQTQLSMKKAFMNYIRFMYEEDLFMADINIIKLINYLHIYYSESERYVFNFTTNENVLKAVSHVNHNFKAPLKLSDVAQVLYVNSSFLSRKFKEEMQIGFNEYVRRLKLYKLAEELLIRGNENELWKEYNFASYRTYLKNFKNQFHMSPKEFINQAQYYKRAENMISELIYREALSYLETVNN
ncbi:hypothetical protein HMPREF3110_03520 [Staphylococcus sp. HMSC10C03]|uniref:helix-turn-helix domain-containing protein n=1 Tax=Staphylococcus sp. HMSC10C03 TaxID=1581078 RepID=UPI0008A22CD4|nr:helix-turn-helix domain-containing protein [Staphylococcus sp. HMSC10C03]OFU79670.1 hypothetical protein HMPREF3110_03520 [Staphylococcus sp. HMSC10C03]